MKHIYYLLALTLAISSCSSEFNGPSPAEYVKENGLDARELENGVFIVIDEPGNDNKPLNDNAVVFDYRGYLASNNQTFDDAEGFSALLGNLITGMIIGMRELGEGGSATIIIPPSMAYGDNTVGPIPGKSTIVFDVVLKQVNSSTTVEGYIERNNLTTTELEQGVHISIIEPGNDKKPVINNDIQVTYTGKFTNELSFDMGEEVTFNLGSLIEGWKIGLPQIGEGGKCILVVPAEAAYGLQGSANIPPNTPLVFEIELIKVGSKADEYVELNNLSTELLEAGVHIIVFNEGDENKPNENSVVTVNYTGKLTDGTEFDMGENASFLMTNIIKGWQVGLKELGAGGSCQLIIPPTAGYGDTETGEIPANSVLIFDIELLNVN